MAAEERLGRRGCDDSWPSSMAEESPPMTALGSRHEASSSRDGESGRARLWITNYLAAMVILGESNVEARLQVVQNAAALDEDVKKSTVADGGEMLIPSY